MDRVFTPESLISLFQAIDREELDLILVGGQAINPHSALQFSPQVLGYIYYLF
jgi:hypothetical protein